MDSNLAFQAEQALRDSIQRLTPEERLNAFLMHSQLMMQLYKSGQRHRRQMARSKKSS
jgi:hypothetical protein